MKTPEEYFAEQDFSSVTKKPDGFSSAERAFIDKYMGEQADTILEEIQVPAVKSEPVVVSNMSSKNMEFVSFEEPEKKNIYAELRTTPTLLMVGCYLGKQEFIVPTAVVQEVIRAQPIAKLPAAPSIIAGVINLRGKVTPLLKLRDILEVTSPREAGDDFFIICKYNDLQMGLMVERIHTMYRIAQEDLDWNIDGSLGGDTEGIAGVAKLNDQLLNIVSVDRIIEKLL